jgi:hypothetical protein
MRTFLGQHELPLFAIQREHDDAVANGQHEQRGRAVDRVAGGNLRRAGLQEGLFGRLRGAQVGAFRTLQYREDGADRHIDVDVRRTVERVEGEQVFALREAVRHQVRQVHFLGGHGGEMAAPFVGVEQDVVGQHVELLCASPCTLSLPASPSTLRRPGRPCRWRWKWPGRRGRRFRSVTSGRR